MALENRAFVCTRLGELFRESNTQYEPIYLEQLLKKKRSHEQMDQANDMNLYKLEGSKSAQGTNVHSLTEISDCEGNYYRVHSISESETSGYEEASAGTHSSPLIHFASVESVDQEIHNLHQCSVWVDDLIQSACMNSSIKSPNFDQNKENSLDSDYYEDCYCPEYWNSQSQTTTKNERQMLCNSCTYPSNGIHKQNMVLRHCGQEHVPNTEELQSRTSPTTLQASDTVSEGLFLECEPQSAWLKWSHDRRASFKRKIEFMELCQTELDRIRVSSPVRKARQESARFVARQIETTHLASVVDEAFFRHPAFPFTIPPTAATSKLSSEKSTAVEETKLTLAQWNALVSFWQHKLFIRSRYCGLIFGFLAVVIGASCLVTSHWSHFTG